MIRFKPLRVDRYHHNTPILSDREIDEFAHAVLKDYRPELLLKPGKIDYLHFLENYLGMRIECLDIYNENPKRPVLAMTSFNEDMFYVFDKENNTIKPVTVPANTVVLDNILFKPGKEKIALFTGMHEGGHKIFHWHIFKHLHEFEESGYESDEEITSSLVCCRREYIENFGSSKQIRKAAEWREHHADYFASAATMPNATFRPYVNGLLRANGYYKGMITLGRDGYLDILADDIIPEAISDVYGVSKRAARIKLRKTGFVDSVSDNSKEQVEFIV